MFQNAQVLAAEISGIVNKAYGVLTNPYTRAEYILEVEGVTIGEADGVDDPSLIMEVMETREELDGADSREEVDPSRAPPLLRSTPPLRVATSQTDSLGSESKFGLLGLVRSKKLIRPGLLKPFPCA